MVLYKWIKPTLCYGILICLGSYFLPKEMMIEILFQPRFSIITLCGFLLIHQIKAYSFFQGILFYKELKLFINVRHVSYFQKYRVFLLGTWSFYLCLHIFLFSYSPLIMISSMIDIISTLLCIRFFSHSRYSLLILNIMMLAMHMGCTFL